MVEVVLCFWAGGGGATMNEWRCGGRERETCKRKPCMIGFHFQVELMKWISWMKRLCTFTIFRKPAGEERRRWCLPGGTSSTLTLSRKPQTQKNTSSAHPNRPRHSSSDSCPEISVMPLLVSNNTMGVRYKIQFNLENSITEPSRVLFAKYVPPSYAAN